MEIKNGSDETLDIELQILVHRALLELNPCSNGLPWEDIHYVTMMHLGRNGYDKDDLYGNEEEA